MDFTSLQLNTVERSVRLPAASPEAAETAELAIGHLLEKYGLDGDAEVAEYISLYYLLLSHNLAVKGAQELAPRGKIPANWVKVNASLVRVSTEEAESIHKYLNATERQSGMTRRDRELLAGAVVVSVAAAIHATGEPPVHIMPPVEQLH